jgi:hypothetical protein
MPAAVSAESRKNSRRFSFSVIVDCSSPFAVDPANSRSQTPQGTTRVEHTSFPDPLQQQLKPDRQGAHLLGNGTSEKENEKKPCTKKNKVWSLARTATA